MEQLRSEVKRLEKEMGNKVERLTHDMDNVRNQNNGIQSSVDQVYTYVKEQHTSLCVVCVRIIMCVYVCIYLTLYTCIFSVVDWLCVFHFRCNGKWNKSHYKYPIMEKKV